MNERQLPEGWRGARLKQLVDRKRSIRYGIVQPGNYDETGRFMVRGQDYSFGWTIPENLFRVSDEVEKKYKNARLKAGDLLITIVGAGTGTVAIVPEWLEGANLTQTTARIAINEKEANSTYCYYFLSSHFGKKLTYQNIKGGAQPGLNCGDIEEYPIVLPPLPEQKKIAEVLSTWDKAIEVTKNLISAKQKCKRALMQQLLTSKKRFPKFQGQEWTEVYMSEIFERVTRKNSEGNKNVVTISAQRGFVRQNEFFNKFVASETLDDYFLVKKGEFCYNKSYSNGYPWGATKRLKRFEKAVVTTLYICFKLREEKRHSGDFFEHFFESGLLDRGLTRIAHEGGRAHGLLNVTPADFFSLKITIPPTIAEQNRISEVLNACDTEINLLKNKLVALKDQKRGLMQQLLTGKKRVKVDEQAGREAVTI
jgi:type I restriction enzyme S subunit